MSSSAESDLSNIDVAASDEITRSGSQVDEDDEDDPVPELVPVTDEDDEAVAPASPVQAKETQGHPSKEMVLFKRATEDTRITLEMITPLFVAYDASFQLKTRYREERVVASVALVPRVAYAHSQRGEPFCVPDYLLNRSDGEGIETWWASLPDAPLGNHQVRAKL
ncbi:hypothetical protein B0H11DRAFT_2238882 [Mycena galericulata]|nr:hypothetical protein B0H11DRAFT_2238882 [Mycena galericulata]